MIPFRFISVEEAIKLETGDPMIWKRKGIRSMSPDEREGFLDLLCVGKDHAYERIELGEKKCQPSS